MTRRGVGLLLAAIVGALVFGAASPTGAVINNFGVDIGATGTSAPTWLQTSFYNGALDSTQVSIKNTTTATAVYFTILTSGLSSPSVVINGFELFVDGDLIDSNDLDYRVELSSDGGTTWLQSGLLLDSSDTNVSLQTATALGQHTPQVGNDDNAFFLNPNPSGNLANFKSQIKLGSLKGRIYGTSGSSSGGLGNDYVNGVNLQVDSTAAVPEPSSLLLFGTVLAGLGWASWRRLSR